MATDQACHTVMGGAMLTKSIEGHQGTIRETSKGARPCALCSRTSDLNPPNTCIPQIWRVQ